MAVNAMYLTGQLEASNAISNPSISKRMSIYYEKNKYIVENVKDKSRIWRKRRNIRTRGGLRR